MKRFIDTIKNIWSIDELRERIGYTLLILAVFRLGTHIVLPGVDIDEMQAGANTGGLYGLLDAFLGGAFSKASIFALGIMPYISASIIMQLAGVAVPAVQKMQKEGESGRRKMTQITRLLTIAITAAQSVGYISSYIPKEAIMPSIDPALFTISSLIILTTGTMFTMWLGERITDNGVGNGISMLIMIGIISRLPGSLIAEGASRGLENALIFILEIAAFFAVIMFTVWLTQGVRRVPVQYAKQVVGNKVYGGQRQYIPIKVNTAGVMPIIFAQALMFLPAMLVGIWDQESELAASIGSTFSDMYSWQYNLMFGIMIIVFTYFYTAITINPQQMADDMKRNNGFIPGVKPGQATSEYIANIIDKVTLPGSVLLAVVAILPAIAGAAGVNTEFAQFFGGTSLLIMVGVMLDTLMQINSYLLMRHYDGMMKSGRTQERVERIEVAV